MRVVELTKVFAESHTARLLDISSDVSAWQAQHVLFDLPEKWTRSFAVTDAGAIVSYCIISRRNGVLHINQLMVHRDARASGIGTIVLREALRRGAETLKVDPINAGAIRFYQRHGLSNSGTENGYLVMRYRKTAAQAQNTLADEKSHVIVRGVAAETA